MPIYEYVCDNCGEQLEVIQKVSDEPLVECPDCRGQSLRKKISQSSFAFKGSGWYVSDYARKSSGGTSSTETKPNVESKPAESTPAADAPAPKTDTA